MSSVEQLAATVFMSLRQWPTPDAEALAALDELVARATQAEADRDRAWRQVDQRSDWFAKSQAEAARLREELDALEAKSERRATNIRSLYRGFRAAEVLMVEAHLESGRLRQALRGTRERTAPDGLPCWCPEWKLDDWRGLSVDDWNDADADMLRALHHECCIGAREALAGPDTPADSQPYTTQARTIDPLAALRDDSQPEETTT